MNKKLTMVSVGAWTQRITIFIELPLNKDGRPVLSHEVLTQLTNDLGLRRGDTFSIG